MQIFVHNLCHDVQSAGRCISVKKNTQTYADYQNVAEHIQFLTVGHGTKIRKYFFKKADKQWQNNTCVNRFYAKFTSTGEEANDQKHNIQDHGNC